MDQCWPSLGFHPGACVTTRLCGNGVVLKSNPMVLHGPRFVLESNLVGLTGFFARSNYYRFRYGHVYHSYI
jgi:hypothetical protein